jgi:hypothetical protein
LWERNSSGISASRGGDREEEGGEGEGEDVARKRIIVGFKEMMYFLKDQIVFEAMVMNSITGSHLFHLIEMSLIGFCRDSCFC